MIFLFFCLGVGKSKICQSADRRGAVGAEIFRNLPLTAPLASQAHAETRSTHVPDKHGILELWKGAWPPVSDTVPDLKLSRHHLRPQPPTAPPRSQRSLIGHHPRPQPRRTRAALAQCPSTRHTRARPPRRWAGFTPHASMVPYRTCRPRRGRSGSDCIVVVFPVFWLFCAEATRRGEHRSQIHSGRGRVVQADRSSNTRL
jgi:hypothetical protein